MTLANKENVIAASPTRRPQTRGKFVVAGLILALLAGIGCSKEKSKPAVVNSSASAAPSPASTAASSTISSPTEAAVPKPLVKKPAKKHASMVTYKDDNYGVSFGYPRKYILKTGEDLKSESDTLAMNFAQPGGQTAVSVEIPANAYPGTDLTLALFQVNVHKGLAEAECEQFALPQSKPDDKNAIQPTDVELGGRKFREVENIMGESSKQVDTKYFHVFENGACYEFALGLTTAWDGNEDGVNLVDREDVFRRLEKILAAVKIAPEATAAAPVVASEDSKVTPGVPSDMKGAAPTEAKGVAQPELIK